LPTLLAVRSNHHRARRSEATIKTGQSDLESTTGLATTNEFSEFPAIFPISARIFVRPARLHLCRFESSCDPTCKRLRPHVF
jgi:hypothetical protein